MQLIPENEERAEDYLRRMSDKRYAAERRNGTIVMYVIAFLTAIGWWVLGARLLCQ